MGKFDKTIIIALVIALIFLSLRYIQARDIIQSLQADIELLNSIQNRTVPEENIKKIIGMKIPPFVYMFYGSGGVDPKKYKTGTSNINYCIQGNRLL